MHWSRSVKMFAVKTMCTLCSKNVGEKIRTYVVCWKVADLLSMTLLQDDLKNKIYFLEKWMVRLVGLVELYFIIYLYLYDFINILLFYYYMNCILFSLI